MFLWLVEWFISGDDYGNFLLLLSFVVVVNNSKDRPPRFYWVPMLFWAMEPVWPG